MGASSLVPLDWDLKPKKKRGLTGLGASTGPDLVEAPSSQATPPLLLLISTSGAARLLLSLLAAVAILPYADTMK